MDGNGHNPTAVTLNIIFDQATGRIDVNGAAIGNEMLALYLLEKAKDAVKLFTVQQQQQKRIVPATMLPQVVKQH